MSRGASTNFLRVQEKHLRIDVSNGLETRNPAEPVDPDPGVGPGPSCRPDRRLPPPGEPLRGSPGRLRAGGGPDRAAPSDRLLLGRKGLGFNPQDGRWGADPRRQVQAGNLRQGEDFSAGTPPRASVATPPRPGLQPPGSPLTLAADGAS